MYLQFISRALSGAIVLFLAFPASSAPIKYCSSVFELTKTLSQQLYNLEVEAKKIKHSEIQKHIKKRNLPEAARLADRLGYTSLTIQINRILEVILSNDSIKKKKEIKEGGSEVYLIEFSSGVKAIFKPEPQFWQNPQKMGYGEYLSNPDAEVMAYKLAKIWGLNFVPMTIYRAFNGQSGSLQAYVKKGLPPSEDSAMYIQTIFEIFTFDYLIRNVDRNYNYDKINKNILNLIFSGDTLWAIDHGNSLRTSVGSMLAGHSIKNIRLNELSLKFMQNLEATTSQVLFELMKDYPDRDAVYEVIERHNQLIEKFSDQIFSHH
jgi:hypothetical protein